MNNPPAKGKDVIYIDIDDEITAIIDKVRSSQEKIVALVLPKRATAFQSIVNMKLLKRTADTAKKHLVLITSETGLLPLAGAVGVHVARSLQSKPEIPSAPNAADTGANDIEETASMVDDEPKAMLDKSRPVGEHAHSAPPSVAAPFDAEDDVPIELDNEAPAALASAKPSAVPNKKNKKLKIPNFNKFRLFAMLGASGLVAIILLWYVGFVVMPRATVTIKTDSSAIDVSLDVTLDTDAQQASIDSAVLAATAQQSEKTASQEAPATGEENKGKTASGEIKIINCTSGDALTIPAGTPVTAKGLTFVTQSVVNIPVGSNVCSDFPGITSQMVAVEAMSPGAKFNIGPSDFKVTGFTNNTEASSEDAMTGGTDDLVKVLAQSDIDSAKQKLSTQDADAIKQELAASLKSQGLYAVEGAFTASDPQISANAKAGDEVTSVTVTQKITYTMLGVEEKDLERLIANKASDDIDAESQTILDHGLGEAVFRMQNSQGSATLITLESTVVAGSDLDTEKIKEQVAGKKANDAKEAISAYPGVTEVTVDYSPFWVSSIPKNTDKIKITVEKPSTKDAQ